MIIHALIILINLAFFAWVISKAKPMDEDSLYIRDMLQSFTQDTISGNIKDYPQVTIRTGLPLLGLKPYRAVYR